MAEKIYTLSYISELKGCTIEDFCQVAHDKGIELHNDPDYTVSSSRALRSSPYMGCFVCGMGPGSDLFGRLADRLWRNRR